VLAPESDEPRFPEPDVRGDRARIWRRHHAPAMHNPDVVLLSHLSQTRGPTLAAPSVIPGRLIPVMLMLRMRSDFCAKGVSQKCKFFSSHHLGLTRIIWTRPPAGTTTKMCTLDAARSTSNVHRG
jgi:hypothetical protein